ncbi:MAG: replication-relaxation family protein [Nitriliruptorales bacterium]
MVSDARRYPSLLVSRPPGDGTGSPVLPSISNRSPSGASRRTSRPDGYGYWRDHGHQTDFFLEYDRGTETLDRVAAKLNGYQDLQRASQRTTPVLFSLPTTDRERALRDKLRWTPVPVATTNRTWHPEPTGAAWLPLNSQKRCRLARVPR